MGFDPELSYCWMTHVRISDFASGEGEWRERQVNGWKFSGRGVAERGRHRHPLHQQTCRTRHLPKNVRYISFPQYV